MDHWRHCAFPVATARLACVESKYCWPHTPGRTKLIEAQQIPRRLLAEPNVDETDGDRRSQRRLGSRPSVFR